jgi:hypothetical protein
LVGLRFLMKLSQTTQCAIQVAAENLGLNIVGLAPTPSSLSRRERRVSPVQPATSTRQSDTTASGDLILSGEQRSRAKYTTIESKLGRLREFVNCACAHRRTRRSIINSLQRRSGVGIKRNPWISSMSEVRIVQNAHISIGLLHP